MTQECFVVDLVKSSAIGAQFLPVLLEVSVNGLWLTSMAGSPIRNFDFKEIFGWTSTVGGFRLITDTMGTYLDMRTEDGETIVTACEMAAHEQLACELDEQPSETELMVQQCLELACANNEPQRSRTLLSVLEAAPTIQLAEVADGLDIRVPAASRTDRGALLEWIVGHLTPSTKYDTPSEDALHGIDGGDGSVTIIDYPVCSIKTLALALTLALTMALAMNLTLTLALIPAPALALAPALILASIPILALALTLPLPWWQVEGRTISVAFGGPTLPAGFPINVPSTPPHATRAASQDWMGPVSLSAWRLATRG